ncbi:Dimethylaniline monooxygenase [Mycena sanguinolenta]|uniref:Dimethylaniline monooxygenase n=1 Tax=Mycena sanguinolenta TaxID=230812 RepID=A0A8H7CUS6_9AGAR|nr:Dimethylaniline monooxygenase [Mycena sanguinolenta]
MAFHRVFLVFISFWFCVFSHKQFQTVFETPGKYLGTFHHPIRRVAVVGAGPAGLQAAAELLDHSFTVRLFERAPHPGGNWLYSEDTPLRESYPDKPVNSTLEIPAQIPTNKYYHEGDDGWTLNDRWTEHWRPRPVWYNLFTNSPKVSTELPDVPYAPETPWVLSHHTIQRHVRSYASHHCLNSNDHCPATPSAPRVASYSTRVEKVEKDAETHTWILTLRRLERLRESNRILEEWWTETFDAVVLATGPYTSAHVPDIEGIVDWSKAKEGEITACKTVLIVGASVSASEIARDISPFAHHIIASVRPPKERSARRLRSLSRFPNVTEFVPEIASFKPLKTHTDGIRSGEIHLINGSSLQGIDEIILATGYRSAALYPPNSTTRRPENIHWTGHYVTDPTLAYTLGRPWTIGRYQSYGLAKVWEGTARLPPLEEEEVEIPEGDVPYWRDMWLGEGVYWVHIAAKYLPPLIFFRLAQIRRYITWLNDASLEHGGRFVESPPIANLELLKYYSVVHLLNNTMGLEGIGLDFISMGAGGGIQS